MAGRERQGWAGVSKDCLGLLVTFHVRMAFYNLPWVCVAHKENGVHAQNMGREEKNRTGTWKNDVTLPGKQNKQLPPKKPL